jgi:shikimate kinase
VNFKIILLGYMGSGKSTIAKKLAEVLTIQAFDLDEMIEKKEKKSISELFSEQGEVRFRKLEHSTLIELLNNSNAFILSLGGGTPCYANNHLLLQRDDVISIYLKTSIDELYNRLVDQTQKRPLLHSKNIDDLKEYIAKHLFERSYFYNQAKYVVSTDGKSVEDVVAEIQKILV